MEQIYTIPVNEAFEECRQSRRCPFCRLEAQLEANETDLILGASMMEPDIREKTNKAGFCKSHFKKLISAGKRLPLALILESHLAETGALIAEPGLMPSVSGSSTAKKLGALACDCYICNRIEYNFSRMLETAALLWETDGEFREKFAAQEGFCLPHAARLVSAAKERMSKKAFSDFYRAFYSLENKYFEKASDKVSRFVKTFDYRYSGETEEDVKTAVEDAVSFLSGEND